MPGKLEGKVTSVLPLRINLSQRIATAIERVIRGIWPPWSERNQA
jgi:hypothetical protein